MDFCLKNISPPKLSYFLIIFVYDTEQVEYFPLSSGFQKGLHCIHGSFLLVKKGAESLACED